jgi:hypothetical protein
MKRFVIAGIGLLLSLAALAGSPPGTTFVENKDQWDCDVYYVSRIPGGNMVLRPGSFRYIMLDQQQLDERHHHSHHGAQLRHEHSSSTMVNGVMIDVTFVGADPDAVPVSSGRSFEYYNFFIGDDETRGASEAYAYSTIVYPSFYNGIDLKVYRHGDDVKYDFMVAAESDPSQIRIRYSGMDKILLENGNLHVRTPVGEIIEKRPFAYQVIKGETQSVAVEFLLINGEVSFLFPEGYDPCHELIIDPLLIFSTFSGSAADNWGSTATPAEKGNLYSAGVTNHFVGNLFSGTYPATAGAFQTSYGGIYDFGILKYDSLGQTLLYASYLGGAESESPHSLVVNHRNELIVLGTTSSANFPTTADAFDRTFNGGSVASHVVEYTFGSDIVISRISPDGKTMLASTFLGGTGNDGLNMTELSVNYGDELRGDVITDPDGFIYVSSVTESAEVGGVADFNGGDTDGIIVKMGEALNGIEWLQFIGGSGTDAAHTIKLDALNNVYTAGGTSSVDFPVTADAYQTTHAGFIDGWVAKLDNNGNILQATYSGSGDFDQIYFLDLNVNEEVYVYGQTSGPRPVTPGVFSEPGSGQFIEKFNNDLSTQELYTVFGTGKGAPDISPTAFMVSDCNYLYMAGWGGVLNTRAGGWDTSTSGLSVSSDALQSTTSGHDFYFIVLAEDAKERLYATFLGGPQTETHIDGGTSRFDKSGVVYHAVCAGCRGTDNIPSSDFPTTAGVHSRVNKSENCNNAAFKFDLSSLRANLVLKGSNKVCIPYEASFDNHSVGGETFIWDFGDGSPELVKTDKSSVKHLYTTPGNYTVWLKSIDLGTCKVRDSSAVRLQVFEGKSDFPADAPLCEGNSLTLAASGGVSYSWVSEDGLYDISGPENSISVSPKDTTRFTITIVEASGCVQSDEVWINVIPALTPEFEFERDGDCSGAMPELRVRNLTDSTWVSDLFYFDFDDGMTSDLDEVIHTYEKPGLYDVRLVAAREGCVFEKIIPMAYGPLKYPNVITPGVTEGKNDRFMVQFGDDPTKTPLDYGLKTELSVYDRWGRPIFETADYAHDWTGADVSGGVYYYHVKVQEYEPCRGWVQVVK